MPSSMHPLAHSRHYEIVHEFETVWLNRAGRAPVVIGDFYGDPETAIIDIGEKWCAVAGLGVILYFLEEPFEAYEYDRRTSQYFEVGREKKEGWWVRSLEQIGPCEIQVRLETGALHGISFRRSAGACDFSVSSR